MRSTRVTSDASEGMCTLFALHASHLLASFLALNRRRGDAAHKPDGKTVHTFGTSLQWHQILLSCFSLKSSDFHAHSVDRVEGGRKKRMTAKKKKKKTEEG